MANKRDLKRSINYITSVLFAECLTASSYSSKPEQSDAEGILTAILMSNSDFIKRISHPEPGIKQTVFFKNLIAEFNKQVSEIIDQINNLA